MSIDDNFDFQPQLFIDDPTAGAAELRRILPSIADANARLDLLGLIERLETGEVHSTTFVSISENRSVQAIFIGGNVHERLKMVKRLTAELERVGKAQLH